MTRLARMVSLLAIAGLPCAMAAAAEPAAEKAPAAPLSVAVRVADHYVATVEPKMHYGNLLTLYGLERLAEISGRADYDAFGDRTLQKLVATAEAKPPKLSFAPIRPWTTGSRAPRVPTTYTASASHSWRQSRCTCSGNRNV